MKTVTLNVSFRNLPWCRGDPCRWCPTGEHIAPLCGVHKTQGCAGWPLVCLHRPKQWLSHHLNALYPQWTPAEPQALTGWWHHLGHQTTKHFKKGHIYAAIKYISVTTNYYIKYDAIWSLLLEYRNLSKRCQKIVKHAFFYLQKVTF